MPSIPGSSSERSGRRYATALLTLLTLLTLVAGCTQRDDRYYGTTRPRHGPDELWYNLSSEPEWIDPGKASESAGGVVIRNIFSGLTQGHPVTLEPMPDVASGWEIDPDGRRYVFHLRSTHWSDGVPVTAQDFEYAWKRVLDPKTASRYATFLYPLRYGEQWHTRALRVRGQGRMPDASAVREATTRLAPVARIVEAPELKSVFVHLKPSEDADAVRARVVAGLDGQRIGGQQAAVGVTTADVVGVRALDDMTLEVQLETPVPYFLSITSFYTAMPVPRHLLRRLHERGTREELWTRPEHLVTNGAYVLREWKFRQYMLLERNPHYWDADSVRIRRVRMSMVDNSNTALNLYEAGELDHIGQGDLPAEFMDHLSTRADFMREPFLATYFLWLNTKAPPMDDPRVRRALSLAVDRERLVKYVTRGGQVPSADVVPDGVGGYRGLHTPLFDPAEARRLMREAGYGPGGRRLPPISYQYNTSEGHKQIAEALQQMWKDTLGIEVRLENQEWKVYLKDLEAMNFQIARMGWIGDYADPNTFLELFLAGNGNNHSNWSSPEYAALMQRANATLDRSARLALLRRAETLMRDAAPVIPLYVYTRSELVKPYVRGYWINYMHSTRFRYMWIDERYYDGVPEPLPNVPPRLIVPDPDPAVGLRAARGRLHAGLDAGPSADPGAGLDAGPPLDASPEVSQ